MDTTTAKELVATHGSLEKAARAAGVGKSSIWRALHRGPAAVQHLQPAPEALPTGGVPARPVTTRGISVRGIAVFSRKPADTLKGRFYALTRGLAYPIDELAAEWHVSVDTLRNRAKEHGAMGYVEATPGEFVACVVHPETKKEGLS